VAGVRNDVLCADRVAGAAGAAGTRRLVMISSAYAANPRELFGETKALAEAIVTSAAGRYPGTDFVAVRVGTLFRGPGSVVEIFERQIKFGGPVTVFDAKSTRRFMSPPRIAELLLHAARGVADARLLAVDVGVEINVRSLANRMIRLRNLMPGPDVEIKIVGPPHQSQIRSRQLVGDDEQARPAEPPGLLIVDRRWPDRSVVEPILHELEAAIEEDDRAVVHNAIHTAVQELQLQSTPR